MRLDPAPAGIGHGGPLAPVCDQRRDRLPEPPAIAGGNDDARLGRHHLSDRAYCCGYDRRAARHRLQDDPRDSVSQAGEHEHIGLLIQDEQAGVTLAQVAMHPDVFGSGYITPGDDVQLPGGRHILQRLQYELAALAVEVSADEQDPSHSPGGTMSMRSSGTP